MLHYKKLEKEHRLHLNFSNIYTHCFGGGEEKWLTLDSYQG